LGLHTSVELLTEDSKVDCLIDGSGDARTIIQNAKADSFTVDLVDQNNNPIPGIPPIKSCADSDRCAVAVTDASGENLRVVLPREQVKKALQATAMPKAKITFSEKDNNQDKIQSVSGLFKHIKFFRPHLKAKLHNEETATELVPPKSEKTASKQKTPAKNAKLKQNEKAEKPKAERKKTAEATKSPDLIQKLKGIFDSAPENTKAKTKKEAHKHKLHKPKSTDKKEAASSKPVKGAMKAHSTAAAVKATSTKFPEPPAAKSTAANDDDDDE
jgi:hypothetical protein